MSRRSRFLADATTLAGATIAAVGTRRPWVVLDSPHPVVVTPLADVAGVRFPAVNAAGFALPWALALLPVAAVVASTLLRGDPRRRAVWAGFAAVVLVAAVALTLAKARYGLPDEYRPTAGAFATVAGALLLLLGGGLTASAHGLAPAERDRHGDPAE